MEPNEPCDPLADDALVALCEATRRVLAQVRLTRAPSEPLEQARAALERAEAILAPFAHTGHTGQASLDGGHGLMGRSEDLMRLFPYSPLIGRVNPISPPACFRFEDGVVHGLVRFGPLHCGPPNHVHGGIIAALFDELLGNVNVMNGLGGMTGTLTVRYRRPTPLFQELRLEGRHTGSEGRKVFAQGRLWLGETLLAEAEGIFIRIAGDAAAWLRGEA